MSNSMKGASFFTCDNPIAIEVGSLEKSFK